MNYTTQGNCPYCDGQIGGIQSGWAGSPEMFAELKRKHDAGHPENQPQQTGKTCPHCGKFL